MNHSNSLGLNFGVFGWNFSFIGDIKLTTDSDGNIYIFNLGIELLFSQQSSSQELDSSTYSLSSQQLLQPYSSYQRIFKQQADGSYEGNGGTLTWNVDHYELEANGSKIVFRPDGQLNYVEYSNGYRLSAGYNNDLLTEISDSNGNSFTIGYNSDRRIETVTGGAGQVNTYSYDATGQYLLSVEDVNGTTSFSYDNPFDPTAVSSITYSDGSLISYDYDHVGRLQQVIYGEGREAISYIFNESGKITSVTDANGEQVIYEYDDNGRLISRQIAGSNKAVNFSYGSAGEVTVANTNGITTELSLNEQGLVLRQSDALGSSALFKYDSQGNLTGIDAPENFSVAYSYDERGNLISQINPLGNEVKFAYEPNYSKLQTVTDARGNDLSYSYNEQGYLTAITYEDGSSENFTVDEQGNTVESINRRGIAIGYEYNALGQVTRVDYQDGSADTYTYDNTGRLTSTTDATGTTLIEYDADNPNLMAKITYSNGRSLAYTYDEVGRRTQMVDQNGSEINYSYDAAGRLAGLTDETGSLIVSYTYDDAGRLAREDNGNGTYTTYTYDLAGQLLNLANYAADDSLNSSYVYTYDDLGRQTSATELDGEWVYEYDAASQLIGAVFTSNNPEIENQDLTYVYDAAGNRIRTIDNGVTTEYQTNNLNQYTSAGIVNYQYDLDGNLTYKSDGVNSWTYSYDDQNRLVSVLEADGSLTEYEYDIFGNRIATVYNGDRTEYLVDPFGYGDVVGEYDGNGNLTAEYAHGIGLVSRTDSSNVAAYYDFNATGSAVGLTGTGGEVLNRYGYLPYGESLFESESIVNPFEFVGQYGVMEEANGLDFMRARYYLPSEGRFLNTDPIGLSGGLNFYAYTENNPITRIDPIGLSYTSAILISGDVVGGIVRGTENQGIIFGDSVSGTINVGGSLTSSVFGNLQVNQEYTRYQGGIFNTALVVNIPKNFREAQVTFEIGAAIDAEGNPIGSGFNVSEITYVGVPIPNTLPNGQPVTLEDAEISIDDDGNLNIDLDGDSNADIEIEVDAEPEPEGNSDGEDSNSDEFNPPPYTEEVEDGFEDAEDQVRRRYYDPLIMDLDGDGIELTSLENSTVYFDIDGDGFREKTGWVKSDDGLLVFDRNNDGYINDISELFGNQTISGFTELQELDSNNDGQITAADTNFGDLQVWRDLDEDGRSDVNELYSLAELNITRIDAVGNPTNITSEGHLITETGSFELADGKQLEVANVWMNLHQQDSYYDHKSTFNSPVVFTEQILNLPNLKGYGNLPDLRIAMAFDSELVTLVESLTESASSGDISAAGELMRPILLRWAGIDETTANNAFSQELAFLEKFVGRAWNNTRPSGAGIATIQNTFASLESELETRLLIQVVESSVGYNTRTERYEFMGDINEAVEQFKQVVISSQTDSTPILDLEAVALAEVIEQSVAGSNWVFNTFTANEDSALSVLTTDILGTDSDLEINNLSFGQISDVVNGTAVINADGNIEFAPAANFNGIAIIEYTITDGSRTLSGLARVNVAPINDAPVASNDTAVTEEDTPITLLATELFGNDSDIERDTLSVSSIDNAVNGNAVINADGNIEFTPDVNFSGIATIDYTVSDGIDSDTASIEITVNSVNDAPLANNDTAAAIDEDTSITILAAELLGNDSDVEGDSFNIISVNSDNGTVTLNAEGQIEFTPTANFNGTATFNYTVSDGRDSSTASVELVVNPVNDAPILTGLIPDLTVAKNAEDSVISLADYFEDLDNGDNLFYQLNSTVSSFQTNTGNYKFFDVFSIENKILTLDYADNVAGTAAITVKVTDSANESVETTFNVSVVNSVPVANNDTATTNENATITISATELLGNDHDSDAVDNLSITRVINSANGTAVINQDGDIEFTPAANFNGTASFEYVVTDGMDETTGLVSVEVNPVNNAPLAVEDTFTTNEDTPVTISVSDLLSNDSDVQGDSLSFGGINNSVNGTAVINQDGNIAFTPDADFNGTASFEYTVTDGTSTSTGLAQIDVLAVNDAPVLSQAIPDLIVEKNAANSVINLADYFEDLEDGDNLAYSLGGTITSFQSSTGGNQFFDIFSIDSTKTLTLGYADGVTGTATVRIKVTDSGNESLETSFNVSVIDPNDETAGGEALTTANDTLTTNEDTPITILASELLSNDTGNNISITEVNNAINGTVIIDDSGNIEFTPDANFNGTASFDYTVSDGTDSSTAAVEIVVSPVNDSVVANEDTVTTNESTSITILASELLGNDVDIEQDSLSIVGVNNSANGTVVINESGNVEFTPDANFNGTASFDYTVTDGSSNDTATVEVVVNPANLAPILVNPIPDITVATNSPDSVIAIADYFEDLEDGDNLAYSFGASSSIQSSDSGKFFDRFSFNSTTKSLILDYADGLIGTSTIRVTATDSANQSVETSFTVSVVESVAETPNEANLSAVDDAIATDEDTPVTVLASELLGNDIGGNLSISSVDSPLGGTAILDESGNVKFTPATNFYGNTSFEYTITDGNSTATGLVSVDVAAVNDAPVLTQAIPNLVLTQNAPNSVIPLADYFEDAENGDNLGYSLRSSSSIQSSTSGKFFDGFSLAQDKALTLNYADDVIGRSTITVKVSDAGTEFVETNFTVSVIDVDAQGDVLLGGDGNDYLVGKQGNDTINGGAGSDYLAGSAGSDRFIFNSPNEGVDTIADFSVEDDTLVFSAAGFGGNLASGMISSQMFTVNTAATSNEHRFIYDAGSGDLSYDSDGTGDNEQVKIASLNNGLALTHNNLTVEL